MTRTPFTIIYSRDGHILRWSCVMQSREGAINAFERANRKYGDRVVIVFVCENVEAEQVKRLDER